MKGGVPKAATFFLNNKTKNYILWHVYIQMDGHLMEIA